MKGLIAILGICMALAAVDIMAATPAPQHTQYETTLLFCQTQAGKQLMVTRNPVTDIFTILYGEDLKKPEQVVALPGNNMGSSYRSSTTEGVENREIYASVGLQFTTVGAQDRQGKKSGYITTMASGQQVTHDTCKAETLGDMFLSAPEQFESLTDVD